jgi:hypothetical protein
VKGSVEDGYVRHLVQYEEGGADSREVRRVVERREGAQGVDRCDHLIGDQGGGSEGRPTVNDAVADRGDARIRPQRVEHST